MDELTPKVRFLESVERCVETGDFIPAFYDRFLTKSEEIRAKFENTDFNRQNRMLLRSLRLSAGATAGEPDSLRELRERAITHDREHLNIEPRLYKFWLDAIIETAREFDEQWDNKVESAWRRMLGHLIDYMIKFY